jgi:hypothetical protein
MRLVDIARTKNLEIDKTESGRNLSFPKRRKASLPARQSNIRELSPFYCLGPEAQIKSPKRSHTSFGIFYKNNNPISCPAKSLAGRFGLLRTMGISLQRAIGSEWIDPRKKRPQLAIY